LLEESNIYKPNWSSTFLQEASNLVQTKLHQEAQLNQQAEDSTNSLNHDNDDDSSRPDPDIERDRIAKELIEEEEKEKKKKKKGKKN
jgi:hypothetical protein